MTGRPSQSLRALPVAVVVVLLGLLAGCTARPPAGMEGTSPIGFDDFADCSGTMALAYAADCEDPRASERYSAPVGLFDEVPEGWTCAAGHDHRDDYPGTPVWWIWTRPAPIDQPQSIVQRRLLVGLEYDIAPREGPVEGVFQMFSQAGAPIVRWSAEGAHGFVEVAVVGADEEVEFDGAVLGPTHAGPIEYVPLATHGATFEPYSRFNATAVPVEAVDQAWGRHGRFDWYPQLYPTNVVRIGGELRYLPAFEIPISGGPDPKTQAGSGHWGATWHGVEWSNVADGNATIRVHQALHVKLDGHFQGLDRAPGCEICPLLDPGDPAAGARCVLP